MPSIAPEQLHSILSNQPTDSLAFIDVRTPAEFAAAHARGALLHPLDQLDEQAIAQFRNSGRPLYVICKSGSRSAKACQRLIAAGCADVYSVDGGTDGWERAGLPMIRGESRVISLERQVRIVAGALVVLGLILGLGVHQGFLGISAFVGCGLVFAGVTDWCGMGMLLARMPWNRSGRLGDSNPSATISQPPSTHSSQAR
jgi:rhodanese-related sulfurtransferase